MGDYTEIDYRVDGEVAVLTLDRPDRLNALTATMLGELLDAFDRVDADDRVRATVVTGRGRGFCAGADLAAGPAAFDATRAPGATGAGDDGTTDARDGGGLLTLRIFRSAKPVIAAINGPAVGVGITMTLPMDIRVMADTAKAGFVFAGRGIAPDGAASWFLPRIVGIDRALEWCLTARVFPAEEALAGGLVRSLHPADEVLGVAVDLAREIARSAAPVSAVVTRALLWRMLGADHPMAAHRLESLAIPWLARSADAREGVTAFFEKRPPRWAMG
ncbi:MAG TPA: enoyl-CoA hydratase-related protein, partial [Acidimicrobiales bacterium]